MSHFAFGDRSTSQLASCHDSLVAMAHKGLSYGVCDFAIIEGHRSPERQQMLFAQGFTKLDGVTRMGRHNEYPSLAFDFMPWPRPDWKDKVRFGLVAGVLLTAAAELELHPVRWGGDWDMDTIVIEHTFQDLGHIELAG